MPWNKYGLSRPCKKETGKKEKMAMATIIVNSENK